MHLAICDDQIADRKQTERLLGRESDRRIPTSGVLYVDSFGSKTSILSTPMIYDAIFMDMVEDCDAVELANMLRADGTTAPIVFCCGKINYRDADNLPDNIFFIDKPILVHELTSIIDELLVIKNNQVKKLEFRNRTETFYLLEEDLLYAEVLNDRDMTLHLFNGETRTTEMNLPTFCANCKGCNSYVEISCHVILNMLYIKGISFFKVTMLDGKQFRLGFGESRVLQQAVNEYKAETPSV